MREFEFTADELKNLLRGMVELILEYQQKHDAPSAAIDAAISKIFESLDAKDLSELSDEEYLAAHGIRTEIIRRS